MGTRHVLQHRNLVINVGKTHEGTQDGLSLDPRRLKKTTQNYQFPQSSVKTAEFREQEEDTGGMD